MSEWILSGAVGAVVGGIVATGLSIGYQHLAERMRLKTDTAIYVTQWLDAIYIPLCKLYAYKSHLYQDNLTRMLPSEQQKDYDISKAELELKVFSEEITTRIHLTYGEGEILNLFVPLKKQIIKVKALLFIDDKKKWQETKGEISKIIDEFHSISLKIKTILNRQASIPYIWNQFKHDFSERPGWETVGETLKRMAQ